MLHNLISKLDKNSVESAAAHCDVPCKIYDPSMIIVPALTVVRMLDIMAELADRPMDLATVNTLSRAVAQKEEHAAAVKHQTVVMGRLLQSAAVRAVPQRQRAGPFDHAAGFQMQGRHRPQRRR